MLKQLAAETPAATTYKRILRDARSVSTEQSAFFGLEDFSSLRSVLSNVLGFSETSDATFDVIEDAAAIMSAMFEAEETTLQSFERSTNDNTSAATFPKVS